MNDTDIIGIIAHSLNVEPGTIDINSSSENTAEWDSLGHMSILIELDKTFDGKVAAINQMASANSVSMILSLLKEHALIGVEA